MKFLRVPKRLFVGTPMRSDRLSETLLPKRLALPIFASDPLSSVAYAPQEIFLGLRAFSSGCAALTGVEAIAKGVPAFQKPKSRNAATTLLLMGGIAVTMFGGLVALGLLTDIKVAEDPARDILIDGQPAGPGYHQEPIIAQVGAAVFGDGSAAFVYLAVVTSLILFFAANTAYSGFPMLGSILARDGFLPRQLHTRGDRLAFSNGIIMLALFAGLLVYIFGAEVSRLIQLYIIGVFVSFTLGQTGMVRTGPGCCARSRTQSRGAGCSDHGSSTPSACSSPDRC